MAKDFDGTFLAEVGIERIEQPMVPFDALAAGSMIELHRIAESRAREELAENSNLLEEMAWERAHAKRRAESWRSRFYLLLFAAGLSVAYLALRR